MIDWNIAAIIAAPIVALFIGAALDRFLREKEKLIAHLGHISSFRVEPNQEGAQPYSVNTHSVVVRNTGRQTATNVRIGHNILPNVSIYPDVNHEIRDLPGGGKEILFPNIVPKKEITISYLYFPPTLWSQINTHLESDAGPIKVIAVQLQAHSPTWLIRLLAALVILGAITTGYLIFELVRRLFAM